MAVLELVGGAALVIGLGTRVVALLLAIDMLGAILIYHLAHGFFAPDGVELVLLLLAGAVTLRSGRPGALALDGLLARPARGSLAPAHGSAPLAALSLATPSRFLHCRATERLT